MRVKDNHMPIQLLAKKSLVKSTVQNNWCCNSILHYYVCCYFPMSVDRVPEVDLQCPVALWVDVDVVDVGTDP